MTIGVIDTGCANIASVRFALERGGLAHDVVRDPDETGACDRLILPGVGAAGPAMARLRERGWDTALAADDRPLMGICLGMQMLFERSAEGDAACLGLLGGTVDRLPADPALVWPHMGWNELEFEPGADPLLAGISPGDHVYFVHGFYRAESDATVALSRYGVPVSALVRRGRISGCQFHPERSGPVGARILANFAGLKP